jgi:hypothetical protein
VEWLMHLAQAVFHQPKKEFGSTCKLTLLRREGEKPLASWAQGCILKAASPGRRVHDLLGGREVPGGIPNSGAGSIWSPTAHVF